MPNRFVKPQAAKNTVGQANRGTGISFLIQQQHHNKTPLPPVLPIRFTGVIRPPSIAKERQQAGATDRVALPPRDSLLQSSPSLTVMPVLNPDNLRLTDFMDLQTLQEIQDSFAAVAN